MFQQLRVAQPSHKVPTTINATIKVSWLLFSCALRMLHAFLTDGLETQMK